MALFKLVIVLVFVTLTTPPALFVIPEIVPVPPALKVPVLVRLARAVVIVPDPVLEIVPTFANVVMLQVPTVPPIFKVPVALFVNVPAPESAVPTVRVPLLV